MKPLTNLWRKALFSFILIALSSAGRADLTPAALLQGKRATVLVETDNARGFGSAFCIDASGFFITNNHVVISAGDGEISLVPHPGEKDQRTLQARVVRTDPALDLALLWTEKPGSLTALRLADTNDLIETASVAAFGYPFRKDLSLGKDEYPSITVITGHITALRKVHGELRELQIDASVNPDTSGGPVLNSKGQVLGVAVAGIPGSGSNFAIPINDLTRFLDEVSVVLSPSALTAAHVQEAKDFVIKVAAFRR